MYPFFEGSTSNDEPGAGLAGRIARTSGPKFISMPVTGPAGEAITAFIDNDPEFKNSSTNGKFALTRTSGGSATLRVITLNPSIQHHGSGPAAYSEASISTGAGSNSRNLPTTVRIGAKSTLKYPVSTGGFQMSPRAAMDFGTMLATGALAAGSIKSGAATAAGGVAGLLGRVLGPVATAATIAQLAIMVADQFGSKKTPTEENPPSAEYGSQIIYLQGVDKLVDVDIPQGIQSSALNQRDIDMRALQSWGDILSKTPSDFGGTYPAAVSDMHKFLIEWLQTAAKTVDPEYAGTIDMSTDSAINNAYNTYIRPIMGTSTALSLDNQRNGCAPIDICNFQDLADAIADSLSRKRLQFDSGSTEPDWDSKRQFWDRYLWNDRFESPNLQVFLPPQYYKLDSTFFEVHD